PRRGGPRARPGRARPAGDGRADRRAGARPGHQGRDWLRGAADRGLLRHVRAAQGAGRGVHAGGDRQRLRHRLRPARPLRQPDPHAPAQGLERVVRGPRPTDGDSMTIATSTHAPSLARHATDSHDLIRVHGARENNLKDVSLEIPKRRLTVFTGVSGSGKSSLVFATIAAESQRLINETYSAFVQGFMPSLSRPDVDLLEGLTTAIVV